MDKLPPVDEVEAFAQQVGWDLVRLAAGYKLLGDEHEYRHILAAINAGNSSDCTDETCTLGNLVKE